MKLELKMNSKGQNLLGKAIIFVALFFIGGVLGSLSLPIFEGRFFISGLIFASLGVGVGSIVFHVGGKK